MDHDQKTCGSNHDNSRDIYYSSDIIESRGDVKMSKKKGKEKLSNFLTSEQKLKYRQIGLPDPTQNWLELFTDDIIHDLYTIMRSCSDNQLKADYVEKELKYYGFEPVGLGTNIFTMSNPVYPGVVFKIALDDCGIADNFNDCILQDVVPRYVKVFARHPSSIVSVQQRGVLPTAQQMMLIRPQILKLLKELSKYFLIVDLSPSMFLNYIIDRDGKFLIADGSDLYPLHQIKDKIRCKRLVGQHQKTGKLKYCGGSLHYNDDFSRLVCDKCGKEYIPSQFRPKKEAIKMQRFMFDGFTEEEREEMERQEILAITKNKAQQVIQSYQTPDDTESDDEERFDVNDPEEAIEIDEIETDEPEEVMLDGSDKEEEEDSEIVQKTIFVHSKDHADIVEEDPLPTKLIRKTPEESEEVEDPSDEDDEADDLSEESDAETEDQSSIDMVKQDEEKPDTLETQQESILDQITRMKAAHPEAFRAYVYLLISTIGEGYIKDLLDIEDGPTNTMDAGDVENESLDNNIHDEIVGDVIKYQVVNEDGSNPNLLSGIYMDVYGDFEHAFDDCGLPLYVSIDKGTTYTVAIRAGEMERMIKPIVDGMYDEQRDYQKRLEQMKAENDMEDKEEVESDSDEALLQHEFFHEKAESDTVVEDESV